MDKFLKREIILDHYKNPFNRGLTNDLACRQGNTKSDSCIDNITIELKIEDNLIVDAHFDGEACAICTSASSMITKNLIGKSLDSAKELIENYNNMINELEYDEDLLKELIVFDDIYLQPARKNCALLPSKCARKILGEVE